MDSTNQQMMVEKNLNDADEPSQRAVHQSTSTQSITSSTLTSLPTIISTPFNPVINGVSSVGTVEEEKKRHLATSQVLSQIFVGCFGLRILDPISIMQVNH